LRLLLDTHIWLWSLSDPRRIGRRVLFQLKDQDNEHWLSPVSTYEALTLHYKADSRLTGTSQPGWREPPPEPAKRHSPTRSRS
jgi:PIN domain nuclease of toxin-antitoxin system